MTPGGERQVVDRRRPLDYLEDDVAQAFFSAREHEAYYLSLKTVDQQRAFHDELTTALVRFLAVATSAGMDVIDGLLARDQPRLGSSGLSAGMAVQQPSIDPEGMRLLGVDASADFDELREAYRAAALVHHPDRGGSNEAMASINHAYEELHALIGDRFASTSTKEALSWGRPPSAIEYRWSVMWRVFLVSLDDWDLERASEWLQQLLLELERDNVPLPPWRRSNLILPSFQLAERFSAAGRREEAGRVLALIEPSVEAIKSTNLNYHYFEVAQQKAETIAAGERMPRFVINHIRQLENAYRLGAVDEKRYASARALLQNKAEKKSDAQAEQETLLRNVQFARELPADRGLTPAKLGDRLVPEPGYYSSRAENLSADQQAQYLLAFSSANPPLDLVQRYAWVRLGSLLRSGIYFSAAVDLGRLAQEALSLGQLQPKCNSSAAGVAAVLSGLSALDQSARGRAAASIQELLEPQRIGEGLVVLVMSPAPELGATFLDDALKLCRPKQIGTAP